MATLGGEAGAHRLDVALGQRIRRFRKARNLSQERLAEAVGVTFQQIQKYERGSNRVSFSRLALIATALQTPLPELISGLDCAEFEPTDANLNAAMSLPGASELVAAYAAIRAPEVRQCLVDLVLELARATTSHPQAAAACDNIHHEPLP